MPASWQETLDRVLTFRCVRYHSTEVVGVDLIDYHQEDA